MTHIGLFEGIGGFSLAARWMGWETIAWCEYDLGCQKVLKKNFPKAIPHGDIIETDFTIYRGKCNILTGGFPCQPFSEAGKRLGEKDSRYLWHEMLRTIKEVQPSFVVAENVYGLINNNRGMDFAKVETDMEDCGYKVQSFIIPACGINAPHKRNRTWIIAHSEGLGCGNGYAENIWQGAYNVHTLKDTALLHTPKEWDGFQTVQVASKIYRNDDGLPSGLDKSRIRQLGNAIVPQVAYEIFRVIDLTVRGQKTKNNGTAA